MFYDEKNSPYQYTYEHTPILSRVEKTFSLQNEIDYIQSHPTFGHMPYTVDNFIKVYHARQDLLSVVFAFIPEQFIKNISIGWSYLLKKNNRFSDIDLNIIVSWEYFAYVDIPPNQLNNYTTTDIPCTKVSLMFIGENHQQDYKDFIVTPNYLHRDLIMREILIWSDRNINLYGNIYQTKKNTPSRIHNLSTRLYRQLKFAQLIFDGLFDHYNTEERIASKMASRIGEAGMIMSNNWFDDLDPQEYLNIFTWSINLNPFDLLKKSEYLVSLLRNY